LPALPINSGPPYLIGSEIYRRSSYGGKHPLAIPRVSTALDLIRALGWIDAGRYIDAPLATVEQLSRFHAPDYIAAVQRAEAGGRVDPETADRYHIGRNGNPVFPQIFSRPATACGATLAAVDRLLAPDGPSLVFSPAGGTHHGRPARASGFCYFNDPVLGILRLLDRGVERVLYVDLDAHHADGVQDALSHDPRVVIVSIHEDGRWPHTGAAHDRGGGHARNLPVPAGFCDDELYHLVDVALLPLADRFEPEILIVQCGADALAEDPQSRLALSNGALWRAVAALVTRAPRRLVLGGGGYNPWAVARCWAGLWGTLDGRPLPDRLPPAAESILRAILWSHSLGRSPPEHWFTTLGDPPRHGEIREAVRDVARSATAP
jgi:acetoin utilization protein AcuC